MAVLLSFYLHFYIMIKLTELKLTPKQASDEKYYIPILAADLGVKQGQIRGHKVLRRSIDARGRRDVFIRMRTEAYIDEEVPDEKPFVPPYRKITGKHQVLIAGSGPAGLFAAVKLIEHNIKPVIIERGKDVSRRKRDVAQLSRNNYLDPDSNYCYGEGGAGTFSDGKLYTRSSKRGNVQRILQIFEYHGAPKDILSNAHPHIGTNILPKIITDMRQHILLSGGEIHFDSRITDFKTEADRIVSVETASGDIFEGDALILATGHSARDIYELLHRKGLELTEKGFAMGLRVEHSQDLIDQIQYSCTVRDEYLPAAAYNLVEQIEGRGVYSFCMCPGGFIVPAATGPEEVVVNGMSPSKRNSKFANSGIVTEIRPEDFPNREKYGIMAGLKYQQSIEHSAYLNGGKGVEAPAQRLTDFVNGRLSKNLPETSYHPGIISSPMHFWLPEAISKRLREGLRRFDNKMKGCLNEEGVGIGVESRTSSPLRIPRDKNTRNHPQIKNLYPCGEGAGFSGGIVSSALDGEKSAEAVALLFNR